MNPYRQNNRVEDASFKRCRFNRICHKFKIKLMSFIAGKAHRHQCIDCSRKSNLRRHGILMKCDKKSLCFNCGLPYGKSYLD